MDLNEEAARTLWRNVGLFAKCTRKLHAEALLAVYEVLQGLSRSGGL